MVNNRHASTLAMNDYNNSLKTLNDYVMTAKQLFLLLWLQTAGFAQAQNSPPYWTATPQRNGQLVLTHGTERLTLQPAFSLLARADDPALKLSMVRHLNYRTPSWKAVSGAGRTNDLFRAVKPQAFVMKNTTVAQNRVNWTFAPLPGGTLTASLDLTEHFPLVRWSFRAAQDGYQAVAFAPFAPMPFARLQSLWQPLIWQERRSPDSSYVSAEFMCSVPMTVAQPTGQSLGVAAHPSEVPFRMPTLANSRFGVLLRNPQGQAQPMVVAPLFGKGDTYLKAGAERAFAASVISTDGPADHSYRQVAGQLYGFKDYRQNGTCSLNETLNNMVRFAMDDHYSHWSADLRGSDYVTDVKGTVKNVSALHPLSVAVVTDNEEIFRRRAVPMTEYLLSREKYLFTLFDGEKNQSPSHFLRGPAAEVSELAALYTYSSGNSPVFRQYALDLSGKTRQLNLAMPSTANSWQNQLALYRMTGQPSYLEKAKAAALDYVQKRVSTTQTDFADAYLTGDNGGQFWTDFAPKWVDLLELYEETGGPNGGEKRFLDAAQQGARYYAMFAWLQPTVPAGNVTVHKGDSIRLYYLNRNLSPHPVMYPVKEQQVPAWRVSNVGLTPEASNTYEQNQGVLLTHYAAYMLRIAQYTGDTFLKDVARSAVVGRYANYPGYDINHEYTTLNQSADYPLHDVNWYTYNQLYYNHIWPHIALVLDYLVADMQYKSGGAVQFPSQYAQGYAYLQSKVYGAGTGTFYGDQNVSLWLPDGVLKTSNEQINYLTGYGNGNLYLALTNQSPEKQTVTIRFNADRVPLDAGKTYTVRVIRNNKPADTVTMQNGQLTATLDGHGISGFVIERLPVHPTFQPKLKSIASLAGQTGFSEQTTAQGKITGLLLSWGQGLHNAYVYLTTTERELKEARLHYTLDGTKWQTITDASYPFEFSIPLTDAERQRGFQYRVESVTVGGESTKTGELALK